MNISPAMLKRWRDQLHLLAPPDAQGWKIDLARQMRDRHGASANWLAKRMRINSGAYLRKLLAQG